MVWLEFVPIFFTPSQGRNSGCGGELAYVGFSVPGWLVREFGDLDQAQESMTVFPKKALYLHWSEDVPPAGSIIIFISFCYLKCLTF